MNSKVQILLATFNGERFLEDQLKSLLQQTYDNIEIICRDDGSIDRTVSILNKYKSLYPDKIRIILDDDKTGRACANFMKLIEIADAPYVMFCDQDDYWFPEKVNESLHCMKKEENGNANVPVLVFCDYIVTDENLEPTKFNKKKNQVYKAYTDLRHLLVQNYVTGCTTILNRALYKSMLLDPSKIVMHDWWAALCASSSGKITHLDKTLMYYRQHGGNCVGAVDIKSPTYIWSKFKNPETRTALNVYKEQARILLYNYPLLNGENKRIVKSFVEVFEHMKLVRCIKLAQGRYYKSTLPRILGQFWYI